MTIPGWAGAAISPLWGIGNQLTLDISAGADWETPFTVFGVDGVTPLDVREPVLEMRRDRSSGSQLLAHFDTSGQSTGLITVYGPGSWLLSMTAADTSALPSGRGFWDCFGQVAEALTAIASGIVVISPRVTAATGSGAPRPVEIDLIVASGEDFAVELAITGDLTDAQVFGVVVAPSGAVVVEFTGWVGGELAVLTLSAADTLLIPVGARWSCTITTPTGGAQTVAAGTMEVTS